MIALPMGLSDTARTRLVLLALPPTLLLSVTRSLETPLEYIDTWVYYGYFLNLLDYKSSLFSGAYYGERLAWLLPGYVIHHLFEPAAARAVLRIGLLYVCVASFFALMKHAVGERAALIGTVLFATAPATTAALSTNYVDGPAMAYRLVALACVVRAIHTNGLAWLAVSGAATVAFVTCNLFLLALAPTIPGVYLYFASRGGWKAARFDLARGLGAYAAGAGTTVALLATINYSLDGRWNFLASSLSFARTWVGQSNPWDLAGTGWLAGAFWLIVPGAVFTCSVAKAIHRRRQLADRPADVAWLLHVVAVWLIYFAWDLARGFAIEYREYVSFMIPATFLALAALIAPGVKHLSHTAFWRLVVVLCLVMPAPYLVQPLPKILWPHIWTPWLMASAVAGLSVLVFVQRRRATLAATLVLVIVHFGVVRLTPEHVIPSELRADPPTIRRIHAAAEAVIERTDGRRVYFWYDSEDPYGDEFRALHSTYLYEYSSLHDAFPAIPPRRSLSPGMQVLVLTSRSPAQILSAARDALSSWRLSGELVDNVEIGTGHERFRMLFLRLTGPRRDEHSAQDSG